MSVIPNLLLKVKHTHNLLAISTLQYQFLIWLFGGVESIY